MDRSLITLISSLASNLLSTSTQFEPYVPNSKQNLYYSLDLLSELGELARVSLETEFPEPAIVLEPARVEEEPLPKLEQTLLPKPADNLVNNSAKPSAPFLKRSKEVDQSLIDALQTLRDSKKFQRKTMGVFSPILRGNS